MASSSVRWSLFTVRLVTLLRFADKDPGADQMQLAKIFIPLLQDSNKGQTGQKSNLRVKNVMDKIFRQSSNRE